LELKLYDNREDKRYRRWKMPLSVARVLVFWWRGLEAYGRSGKGRRFTSVVIAMSSSKYVDNKELDILGYPKSLGWSLPVVVVEALANKLS
jgi:hypothetical protein